MSTAPIRRALCLAALVLGIPTTADAADVRPPERPDTREVMFVGNNWEGTADIVDLETFSTLARINVVPDLQERLFEITSNPLELGYFIAIRELVGEGNHQYVDDMFSSHDGRFLYVSRPSLKDVVGIDLGTQQIVWRVPVEGYRADHMAISPDGSQLLVSASTASKVHVIDPHAGRIVGEFASGDSPHENQYSRDGRTIYHASIGLVYTPTDQPMLDSTKGDRWFQVVDARTLEIRKRLDIGKILEAHGFPGMSSAVRPMAISPDERFFYFQLSFLHGFVEFDLHTETPRRIASLPVSAQTRRIPREQYLLDSAHHGLAMNAAGTKLCVAGTMSDYAALVSRESFTYKLFDIGRKPYWATNGANNHCWVSSSGDDRVVVLDYDTEEEVARIPVGDHPQRVRVGAIRKDYLAGLPAAPDTGFELGIFHRRGRAGIGVAHNRVNIGCRADGAASLRLTDCRVRLRAPVRGGRPVTLARGEASHAGRRSFTVRLRMTRAGRALVRRRPKGFRATIVAEGRDSLDRERTVRRKATFRRARTAR